MTRNIRDNQDNSPTIHNVRLDSHFTVTFNKTPEDDRLSFAAKGLLWYLLSRPADWSIYTSQLSSFYKGQARGNGREAIESMMKELKEFGYLKYTKSRNSDGTWKHRYDVYPMQYDNFQIKFPEPVKALMVEAPKVKTPIITRKEVPRNDLKETTTAIVAVLSNLEISEDEKSLLSQRYDQKTIEDAVFLATHPNTKIKKSLIATIIWACKGKFKYEPSKSEQEAAEKKEKEKNHEETSKKNKSLALKIISENSHLLKADCEIKLSDGFVSLKTNKGISPLNYLDENFEKILNFFIKNNLTKEE